MPHDEQPSNTLILPASLVPPMPILDIPALTADKLTGAKLYANRDDLIADLKLPRNPVVGEIGVALGTFSKILIDKLKPSAFHGFDLFDLHNVELLWGVPSKIALEGLEHGTFYKQTMSSFKGALHIHEGPSEKTLRTIPEKTFDMLYIDGQHTYEPVLDDARQAARCLKPDGVLVFNDYIHYDPFQKAEYGIVKVVNDMVMNEGWRVIGFALQRHMFCDIAICRHG